MEHVQLSRYHAHSLVSQSEESAPYSDSREYLIASLVATMSLPSQRPYLSREDLVCELAEHQGTITHPPLESKLPPSVRHLSLEFMVPLTLTHNSIRRASVGI